MREMLVTRYWKILENTGYASIADTGRFWKILVIPILQILEDSGKYWLYQYCRYWKISYEVAECTCIIYCFVCPVCASVIRGRTVYRETGRKETRGGRKYKRGKKREWRKVKRGGRNEKRGGNSCGETDSAGHTKTASTTSEDTSPNSIRCSDQSTFSITGPFQGHQYY
jgi:hypothetical protein